MGFQGELAASLAVIALMIWCYISSNRNSKYYNKIPGPPGLPILGNALDLNNSIKIFDNMFKFMKQYGGVFKLKVGPFKKIIVVTDYKMTELILGTTKILNKSDEYLFLRPWLGTGLLTSDVPKWQKRRKVLSPSFHFQVLNKFIDVIHSQGNVLINRLETEGVGKNSVNIYPYVTLCALDIICECAMGVCVNAQKGENSSYVHSVKEMCRIVPARGVSPIEMYDFLFPLTPNYYKQKKALMVLHQFTDNVITTRRKEKVTKTVNEVVPEEDMGIKERMAFLDILLECTIDGKPFSDADIREEVDTFMFEGHDTTTSGISFTLYCLAGHPEIQKLAVDEQKAIFGTLNPEKVTFADLQNMKYLELVIKETLRLYPPSPVILRKTKEEIEMDDGTVIPPGVTYAVFSFGIHRNPKYFPEPDKFNPDRFNYIDGTSPYSYIPFSAGPRNCIGQKFAMLEMKSSISKILRKFKVLPAIPEHFMQLTFETTLKSTNGIRIRLEHRD